ncbi:MAG TPA: helix-turn-helix domain-containing protein [Dongiaceae bacterium]|nr:helix-turn-helix domain-containing protein [Dongiaceae bacterium]
MTADKRGKILVGMRERKRQARSDEIIDAAMELFRNKGYENTRMEEIAERVDISAPTLYRYFPTKSSLLIAFHWKARARRAALLDDYFEKSIDLDPVTALTELLHLNNKSIGPKSERKLWREAMAALLRFHDAANDDFRRIKREFEERIEQLLQRLASDSRIAPDAPLTAMTEVLYAIASENFYRMIANEFRNVGEERATLRGQVALVLKGWLNA